MSEWTPKQSSDLYRVRDWSDGFFSVSEEGNLLVHPRGSAGQPATREIPAQTIDLPKLVGALERRGLRRPILIRFSDILSSRIEALARSFEDAIAELLSSSR